MAIYDTGTASLAASGQVTGVGTQWTMPLTLIRVGATIIFKTNPLKIYTISEITSDTSMAVYNPNGETVPAGTGYAILAHDGISVQGLAQDVAETLRYYQSKESYVAQAVDAFNNFDSTDFQSKVEQVENHYNDVLSIGSNVQSLSTQVENNASAAESSASSALASADRAESAADSVSGVLTISFIDGGVIESGIQQAILVKDGFAYSYIWSGELPKIIPANSTPQSTGGLGIGRWLKLSGSDMISLSSFNGVVADGVTDTRQAVQDAIDYCASISRTLFVPDGIYCFGNFFTQPSNSHIVFDKNAWFKLLNSTTWPSLGGIGHFQNTGTNYNDFLDADGGIKFVEASNVSTYGMKLDCNNIPGENGVSSVAGRDILHENTIVKNCLHTNSTLGGRAFQFEGKLNRDIRVINARLENCSIGCNSQGIYGSDVENVRSVTYDGISMFDVGVPFNVDGQSANPQLSTAMNQSVTAFNVSLYNCGAPKQPFSSSLGGGIICGDRGAGLSIFGLRLLNETSYGGISSIVRGVVYGVSISDAEISAPYISSIYDNTPPEFGSPSNSAVGGFVRIRNMRIDSDLDYIVNGNSGQVGPILMDIEIDQGKASITTLFNPVVASIEQAASNSRIKILDYTSGFSSGEMSLYDMFQSGNSPSIIRYKQSYKKLIPVDVSGGGLQLTLNREQILTTNGNVATVSMNLTYPENSDGRASAVGGLNFSGISSIEFAGMSGFIYGFEDCVAVVKGGENFVRLQTQNDVPLTNAELSGRTIVFNLSYIY